ncbi:diguanylate cyclase [Marichromatium gracile]|uniref:diguanylate cyclase n=2 Tax=Chromatiaceae TaxID=1046 RepID=A0ABR5VD50_MARGR|nr:diguanylate cyclase [Marichromatium gracile]
MSRDMLEFNEDLETSADYLRKAIPLMVQRGIPPTPYNYALWYAHVQGLNPELSRELLAEFPVSGSYSAKKSESLFFKYFIKNYLPNNPKAQNLLVSLVAQLARAVARNLAGSQQYGDSLREARQILDQASDPMLIQETLSQLLADTRAVEGMHQEFQGELQSARDEVELLKQELARTQQRALVDALTNIPNRRAFDHALLRALQDPEPPTCLLLLDLDHFKQCNDTFGHLMGDRVLQITGQLLADLRDEQVFVARYGGEEFAIIVEGRLERAVALAEQVRKQVSAIRFRQKPPASGVGTVTTSIGVVEARAHERPEELIERADRALYRAKSAGRDRVEVGETPAAD